MLVLSSQSCPLGTNPIMWLCGQEPVYSCQKGPPTEKAKRKRWWTYLSQFGLTVHHIQGRKNKMAHYISPNNDNALLGESSEALAKEMFQRMDVQLDLLMRTAGILEGCSLNDYQSEYQCVPDSLCDGLQARLIDGSRWYKDNQCLYYVLCNMKISKCLYYEDRIVVPEARLDGCLHWAHLSSWQTGCKCSVEFFRKRFYSQLTCVELRTRMQPIVESCGCHTSKESDSRDRGLVSSLPIPYCASSLLHVEFIHGLPKFAYACYLGLS